MNCDIDTLLPYPCLKMNWNPRVKAPFCINHEMICQLILFFLNRLPKEVDCSRWCHSKTCLSDFRCQMSFEKCFLFLTVILHFDFRSYTS